VTDPSAGQGGPGTSVDAPPADGGGTGGGSSGRRFGVFWTGQVVSWVGSEVTVLALPLLAALTLGARPAQMAWLVAVAEVPALFAGLVVGPLLDRQGPRRLLFVTEYGRAALVALVPLLAWFDALTLPTLVCIVFAVGCLTVVYEVAGMALVPDLLPATRLIQANSRLEGARSVTQIAGPSLAGFLVQALGAARIVLVDVVSYLISAVSLHMLRLPARPGAENPAPVGVRAYLDEIRDGVVALWRDPRLRLLGFGVGAFNVFLGLAAPVEVLYILRVVGLPPALLGVATGVGLAGGLVGAVVAGRLTGRFGVRASLTGGLIVAAPAQLFFVVAAHVESLAVVLTAAGFFLNSFGVALYVIGNVSLRQAIVEPTVRGRVFASARVLSRGGLLVGAVLGGSLATATSLSATLIAATFGQFLVAFAYVGFRRVLPATLPGHG
jgi:MFS family permease